MGIFAVRGRRPLAGDPGAGDSSSPGAHSWVPHRFEAVGEALASGSEGLEAAAVVGQQLSRDGVSLAESLERLRTTWRQARGTDPSYDAVTTLATSWSEASMGYLHQMSCEDPLTGISSQAHLRSLLGDLYRRYADGHDPQREHALVVCEVGAIPDEDPLTRAMQLARVGELARTVFSHGEPVARLGSHRVALLVGRDDRLGRRVRLLRTLLAGQGELRVWIEGLPGSDHTAAMLLDELARS